MKYSLVKIKEHPELVHQAAFWFQHCFGIPEESYRQSMERMLAGSGPVPGWYVAMDGDRIVGGLGVIENDFHDRPDLTPNVCAVYVDESYRCRGIAGALLHFVCQDMAQAGVRTLYLVTDHTSFYERYGWEFFCTVHDKEGPARLYRHDIPRVAPEQKISLCGDNCAVCPRYQAHSQEELHAVANLWHKIGWRDRVLPPEEIQCKGCAAQKECTYNLKGCTAAQGVEYCAACRDFPCNRLEAVLEKSREGENLCKARCTPEEYTALEQAFFHKEENLELLRNQ